MDTSNEDQSALAFGSSLLGREVERRAFLAALITALGAAGCSSSAPPPDAVAAVVAPTSEPDPTAVPQSTATPQPTEPEPTTEPTPTPEPVVEVDFEEPFTLGVASGDPTEDSVILWTRLAPDPHNPDKAERNGMPDRDIPVFWEIATSTPDGGPDLVLLQGEATASAALGHSVHVDVQGLPADTWFVFRFIVGPYRSAPGRTRTMPSAGATPALTYAFSSCQRRDAGAYAAHRALVERGDDIDLFFWLGDYIYEGGPNAAAALPDRQHDSPEIENLPMYRNRYALYKTDPHLQAHHATRPWIVTWDDHELDNDYAGETSENEDEPGPFRGRRAAAYQAWYEHMPVRLPAPDSADWQIYRDVRWGDLAHFMVLDGRQYRDDQPTDGNFVPVPGVLDDPSLPIRTIEAEANDPNRTLLGRDQEDWLVNTASGSSAQWKVLAQPVFMHGLSIVPGANPPMTAPDTWDGYHGNRKELLGRMVDVENLVVLSGDFHSQSAADVRVDPYDRSTPIVAAEFMSGAISSQFPIPVSDSLLNLVAAINPHINHLGTANGFVVCEVNTDEMRTGFWSVTDVLDPNSIVVETSTYKVTAGTPGLDFF